MSEEHLKYFFEYLYVFKDKERRSYKDEGWVLINALGAYYAAKRRVSSFITKLTNMGYVEEKKSFLHIRFATRIFTRKIQRIYWEK